MELNDKETLRINHTFLLKNVIIRDIGDYLYEQGVLTPIDLQSLECKTCEDDRSRRFFIDILPKKGPNAFRVSVLVFCVMVIDNACDPNFSFLDKCIFIFLYYKCITTYTLVIHIFIRFALSLTGSIIL